MAVADSDSSTGVAPAGKTILVVDDDSLVRKTLARFFRREGYDLLEAADGERAWEVLRTQAVDLLVTDVRMPGKTGIELLELLRADNSQIPVIIITGRPSVEAAVDCMKTGALDYISKPVKPEQLRERVRAILLRGGPGSAGRLPGDEAAAGEVVGGYRVLRVLGEGSVGVVCHVARTGEENGEGYALKILKIAGRTEKRRERMLRRFLHEAEAASRIEHPNVVRFVEYGLARKENIPFLVMEYFPFPTLAAEMTWLQSLGFGARANLLRQLAGALSAIHKQGVCHRDVKPSNVLFDRSQMLVKISDFGVAQLPDSDLTVASHLMGSPAYMAPEAFLCARVDHRADIFSLGVLAYELFLGSRPFPGQTIPVLAKQIPAMRPLEPRKLVGGFPPFLQAIMGKMMKKRPANRYATAQELADDLAAFCRGDRFEAGVLGRVRDVLVPDWS